ncbi:hypothetical protein ACNTMW_26345 [Planosporangium sp. 12N6]
MLPPYVVGLTVCRTPAAVGGQHRLSWRFTTPAHPVHPLCVL